MQIPFGYAVPLYLELRVGEWIYLKFTTNMPSHILYNKLLIIFHMPSVVSAELGKGGADKL
jgi:hypothetical protein